MGSDAVAKKVQFPNDVFNDINAFLRACFAEFIGLMIFVFIGCGSVMATGEFLVEGANPVAAKSTASPVSRILPIATAFGVTITVVATGIGPISGGNLNPAVTWALLLVRKISPLRAMGYWFAQFLGACFGAALIWGGTANLSYAFEKGENRTGVNPLVGYPPFSLGANQVNPRITWENAFLLEIVGTGLLIGTVLTTAVDVRAMSGVSNLAPMPIGFAVWVVHLVLIPFDGCGINPARTFGPALINSMAGLNTWGTTWWVYYLGPWIGSTLATMAVWIMWGQFRVENFDYSESNAFAFMGGKHDKTQLYERVEERQKFEEAGGLETIVGTVKQLGSDTLSLIIGGLKQAGSTLKDGAGNIQLQAQAVETAAKGTVLGEQQSAPKEAEVSKV